MNINDYKQASKKLRAFTFESICHRKGATQIHDEINKTISEMVKNKDVFETIKTALRLVFLSEELAIKLNTPTLSYDKGGIDG